MRIPKILSKPRGKPAHASLVPMVGSSQLFSVAHWKVGVCNIEELGGACHGEEANPMKCLLKCAYMWIYTCTLVSDPLRSEPNYHVCTLQEPPTCTVTIDTHPQLRAWYRHAFLRRTVHINQIQNVTLFLLKSWHLWLIDTLYWFVENIWQWSSHVYVIVCAPWE